MFKFSNNFLCVSTMALMAFGLAGCNSAGTEKEAMDQFSSATLQTAKTNQDRMKALYTKAGGSYSSLTPEDKAEFVKLNNGSDITAQQSWGYLATQGKAGSFSEEQKAANKR